MAYSQFGPYIAFAAGDDLSDKQFHLVSLDESGQVVLAGSGFALGVLTNDPRAGETATVQYTGVARVVAGAALTYLDHVTSDASGRAVVASAGDTVVGLAIGEASGNGDLVSVLLLSPSQVPTAV